MKAFFWLHYNYPSHKRKTSCYPNQWKSHSFSSNELPDLMLFSQWLQSHSLSHIRYFSALTPQHVTQNYQHWQDYQDSGQYYFKPTCVQLHIICASYKRSTLVVQVVSIMSFKLFISKWDLVPLERKLLPYKDRKRFISKLHKFTVSNKHKTGCHIMHISAHQNSRGG